MQLRAHVRLPAFVVAQSCLGFGRGPELFPASLKCVAEWFPKKGSGRWRPASLMPAQCRRMVLRRPLIVPWNCRASWLALAFLQPYALGFSWLISLSVVLRKPEELPFLTRGELEYIQSDPVGQTGGNKVEPVSASPANRGVCRWKIHD